MVIELYHNKTRASTPAKADKTRGGLVGAAITGGLIGADGAGTPGWVNGMTRLGGNQPAPSSLFPEIVSPYLECGANRIYAKVCDWLEVNCGDVQWFIPGRCDDNGHRVAKEIACGKEWCPRCQKKGSIAHNRRTVRWLIKVQQFKRMQYMVFTIPEDIRPYFRTSERLATLGKAVQELLKRQGFLRGLRRWHWMGDKSHKWHPHLNILTDGGYLNGATVQSIKDSYRSVLEEMTGREVPVVSVKVGFKRTPGDMVGCLAYVTRATFLDYQWDIDMALELEGFRNMVVWGGRNRWKDHAGELAPEDAAWQLHQAKDRIDQESGEHIKVEAIQQIAKKECPVCGSHIEWDKPLPVGILDTLDKESLGAGYYLIHDRKPPSLVDTVSTRVSYFANTHGWDKKHIRVWEPWLRARKAELWAKREAEFEARKAEILARRGKHQ